MAYIFSCKHCGREMIVHYLKPGEEAECKVCKNLSEVPEDAVYRQMKKEIPKAPISVPVREGRRQGRDSSEVDLKDYAPVRTTRWILNIVWYFCLFYLCFSILIRIIYGPDSAIYSTGPHVGVDLEIIWDTPLGLKEGEIVNDLDRPVIIGHKQAIVRIPGGISAGPIFIDRILKMILILVVVFFLRRFFNEIVSGNPFTKKNAMNVEFIGYSVMAAGPLWGLYKSFQASYLGSLINVSKADIEPIPNSHLEIFFIGLAIVALAQLFRLAARIQRDQELTI